MDSIRTGRILRALRHRRGWRQVDLARAAGVSQDLVSLAERGHLGRMQLDVIEALFRALEADTQLLIRWRAGDLDRLLDEGHARLVGKASSMLDRGLGHAA